MHEPTFTCTIAPRSKAMERASQGTLLVRAGETEDQMGEVRRGHLVYSMAGNVDPEANDQGINTRGINSYPPTGAGRSRDVPAERAVRADSR